VVAAVVPAGETIDAQDLFLSCRRALEPNFVPTFVQVVQAIPKTASEKPQERILLQEFRERPQGVHLEQGARRAPVGTAA